MMVCVTGTLNALTSPETVLNGNSLKIKLYNAPSPILHCTSQLGGNIEGQGYRVSENTSDFDV